ncbi:MAG: ATP-dependent Clp protease adaptor ClpS [Planctomycetales bacterium]|nr:ATP-dependent Clp protease adaptor ClpS [Planctomycetales bacterium]NIM07862.1 ATP-dependent Clp protease adaptor ClpS [Planctomycetales bacterium]NIN07351.1 ATP-dependent Clp protease adaptor ClpS [Planctomycetales bacterium]NIN76455.1 ATP-dependent Clp protease adaptor ClpS [Planctomycetales bacterium]NIO33646.1 ATP-dependent Clp protease adaptor ClpS [Planctomycetales bacterium]
MDQAVVAVVKPKRKRRGQTDRQVRRQPRYHVLLWDDDDHTYDYVIGMLRELFGYQVEEGFQLAEEVDNRGKAIVLTTTREHAELKRDQIHAYGHDPCGSMSATIEPER